MDEEMIRVPLGSLLSKLGPLWCVVKVKDTKVLEDDDMRPVGSILCIAKTEAAAKRAKKKWPRGLYAVKLYWLEADR